MRLFHISDLHIGKRVCGFSMMEDQRYILEQILQLCGEKRPDGILIAGDLYDRPAPSAEAVELVDWFLSQLASRGIEVWAISGNHDSAERVAYGAQMLEQAGIHMARAFDGQPQRYALNREADVYLLPFLKPAQVRRFFPDRTIETTQQAVEAVLAASQPDKDKVNILVMHQFLLGASVCDSEEVSVGGTDQVDAAVTEQFDYVALGHLHRPQSVGRETVRYCGSPLKYSFSEAGQGKSLTIVEIETGRAEAADTARESGSGTEAAAEDASESSRRKVSVCTVPLVPRLDLREIRGPISELLRPEVYSRENPEDYLHVTLTDEGEVLDAIGRLREVYPNIMRLDFERREAEGAQEDEIPREGRTPEELFAEFFVLQNGYEMDEAQRAAAAGAFGREAEVER